MSMLNYATAFRRASAGFGLNNSFRRLPRSENSFLKGIVFGQYYVAAMLFIVNAIYIWRYLNMLHSFSSAKKDDHFFSVAFKDWTTVDYQTFYYSEVGGQICIQVPAAMLIYLTSTHKFLTTIVAVSSILHLLTPVAFHLHPSYLAAILYVQILVQSPLRIGVLSMWKDWATPETRTKFVFLSFSSFLLSFPFSLFISNLSDLIAREESFYISGVCGLVWSILWFLTVADTPPSNLQCPTYEQSCLEHNTVSTDKETTDKERPKLSEVPWKRILTSNPVYALCLIYFKIGGSFILIMAMLCVFVLKLDTPDYLDDTSFHILFAVIYTVILFTSTIITDLLIIKYSRIMKVIKKSILCGVLIIHGFLLLGTLFHHTVLEVIFFCLSYFAFSISLAGFITNALDLSSRYVAIIGGFIETFYILGVFLSSYYFQSVYKYSRERKDEYPFGKILSYEVVVTIFVAVIFLNWGSVEEQPWSLNSSSGHRSANSETHATTEVHELRSV